MTRLLLVALLLVSCAPIERQYRYSLAWLDREAIPESTTARVALAPLAIPVGTVAWIVDGVLIRFGLVGDDAWGDVVDVFWELNDDTSDLFRATSLPIRVVLTPVGFVLDFVGRWLLPIPDRDPPAAAAEPAPAATTRAEPGDE